MTDEVIRKDVLIEHYNSVSKTLLDKTVSKSVEQKIYVLDKPFVEYLKNYRDIKNVDSFLKAYEPANKVFITDERVLACASIERFGL